MDSAICSIIRRAASFLQRFAPSGSPSPVLDLCRVVLLMISPLYRFIDRNSYLSQSTWSTSALPGPARSFMTKPKGRREATNHFSTSHFSCWLLDKTRFWDFASTLLQLGCVNPRSGSRQPESLSQQLQKTTNDAQMNGINHCKNYDSDKYNNIADLGFSSLNTHWCLDMTHYVVNNGVLRR